MFWRREALAPDKNDTKIPGSSRPQPCHYNNYAILTLWVSYQNDIKTMFQIHKLPQHNFLSLHVKKVHSSWTWQMHRRTAQSIISGYAAAPPPTQLYQQTSNKKILSVLVTLFLKKYTTFSTHMLGRELC